MTFMIISLLLPSLTAVAEAMSSDPLRVCALSPSPRGSVFFTCTNLSVCTQRRRFLPVTNHRSLTLNIRRNRGRTTRASSTAESSGVRRGRSTAHAARPAPVQGTLATSVYKPNPSVPPVNGYKCTRQGRAQQIKSRAGHMVHRQRVGSTERRRGVRRQRVGLRIGRLLGRRIGRGWGIQWNTFHKGCAGYIAS